MKTYKFISKSMKIAFLVFMLFSMSTYAYFINNKSNSDIPKIITNSIITNTPEIINTPEITSAPIQNPAIDQIQLFAEIAKQNGFSVRPFDESKRYTIQNVVNFDGLLFCIHGFKKTYIPLIEIITNLEFKYLLIIDLEIINYSNDIVYFDTDNFKIQEEKTSYTYNPERKYRGFGEIMGRISPQNNMRGEIAFNIPYDNGLNKKYFFTINNKSNIYYEINTQEQKFQSSIPDSAILLNNTI